MTDELEQLETWIDGLAARLAPAERRRLARALAFLMRRQNVARIQGQQNPDGSPYAPRKRAAGVRARKGALRRNARSARAPMFLKLRRAGWLVAEGTETEAIAGFRNAVVSRVARIHQEGLSDRVSRKPGAPEVRYPRRILLGLTEQDRGQLIDLVLEHLEA